MRNTVKYKNHTFIKYISREKINNKNNELSNILNVDYNDKNPVFIGVLNGCVYFMMDILKDVNFSYEISFVKISSYKDLGKTTIKSYNYDNLNIKNRNVLIFEDIIDSGETINHLLEEIINKKPKDIKVLTLLKKGNIESKLKISKKNIYYGFEIEDKYVVGYVLDINNLIRGLKDIYIKYEEK